MKALSVEQSIIEGNVEVNKLFDFVKINASNLSAYEMEQAVFTKVMQIGLLAMKCYFGSKGTGDKGPELNIDGNVLKKESDLRGRDYFSVFGKIKVPRTYYHTEGETGVFPLEAEADLPQRCYSYLLQEWMDFFSIRDTFEESQLSIEKLLGLKISKNTMEVINRETSKSYDEFYETKELPKSEGNLLVMGFDGKGVPVIKREAAELKSRYGKGEKRQKKKEAMVGVIYTTEKKERSTEEVAERLIYPERAKEKEESQKADHKEVKAQNIRRLASLERSRQEVIEDIVKDANKRDPNHEKPLVVLIDGALHLWGLVALILKGIDYVGILDIIHVTEYLWKAAVALHGEKDISKNRVWVYERLLSILKGRVGGVIGGLKQTLSKQKLKKSQRKIIEDVIRYYENHREWMKYDEYLAAGYPIGTGVVESTCGHTVKDRMEGTGCRWSIKGAEGTLLLRSVYTSHDWDAYWQKYMESERKRLYAGIFNSVYYSDDYDSMCYSDDYFEKQIDMAIGL